MASANQYPGIDSQLVACVRIHANRVCERIPEMEIEDIEQELMLHVHRRLTLFDPARASIRTFTDRVVRNRAANLVQAAQSKKRGCGVDIVPLDEIIPEPHDGDGQSAGCERRSENLNAQAAFAPEGFLHLRIDLWRAFEGLPPALRSCFLGLFDSSVTHAAHRAGISRAAIYHRIEQIRERFRATGLQEYASDPDTFGIVSVSDQ